MLHHTSDHLEASHISEAVAAASSNRIRGLEASPKVHALIERLPGGFEAFNRIVSPDDARAMRDTMHFPRQRKIRIENVQRLSDEMMAGRFILGIQVYIGVLPNGTQYILNANHTLESICVYGKPLPMTVTRKAVADMDEASRIYAVFDIQRARSWSDSAKALDIDLDGKLLSAIAAIEEGFCRHPGQSNHASRLGRFSTADEYREMAQMFAAATKGLPKAKFLRRAPVMAVVLEALRYQPSAASEFLSKIANDDGLAQGSPEKALLRWLENNKGGSAISRREAANATALAWNAFFLEETRTVIKPNAMASFYLLGTPWERGLGD